MPKSKTVIKSAVEDSDLVAMFNQMVGASAPDPGIALPKYNNILKIAEEILKILDSFAKSTQFQVLNQYGDYTSGLAAILEFVQTSTKDLSRFKLTKNDKILSSAELEEINKNPAKLEEYIKFLGMEYKLTEKFNQDYQELKENNVIKEIIMMAKNLKTHLKLQQDRVHSSKHDLEDKEHLSADFIKEADGDFLPLFNFTKLDFKQLFYSDLMSEDISKYILYALHLIHNKSFALVKIITSPDIDVDRFSGTMVGYIDELNKKIPRCNQAFAVIKNSVHLFKDNFSGYYKDFVISKNPAIIIENFITDVASNSKNNPELTRQFREITNFCHKNTAGKINDPRMAKMFSMVSSNISILEKDEKKSSSDN